MGFIKKGNHPRPRFHKKKDWPIKPSIASTYVMYFDGDGRFKAIVTVEEVKSEISSSDSRVGAGRSVKSKKNIREHSVSKDS